MPAHKSFAATPKQREIMTLVCREIAGGWKISSVDLHGKLSYGATVSRQAVLCSIKFLVKHGILVTKREGRHLYLTPTARGMALYGPKPLPE